MTQASGSKPAAEFSVVVNSQRDKKYSILQFQNGFSIEKNSTQVTLARENNLRDYKTAHNIGALPTSGAGSEFGREAKEEARRRKLGYIRKNYNPDNQPWMMQVGADKKGKKLKGNRNGGILENSSYFVFIRKPEGVFEAVPVDEWYNFKSTVTYNNLNDEEAEEEFARRDRTLNLFNIMVRKKLKKDVTDEEDSKEKVKSQKRKSGLMLTEMEDWADLSEEDEFDAEPTTGKGKSKGKGKRKKKKDESEDEAFEDSDDGDAEAKQVDYMSDTSDSDSDVEQRDEKDKYAEQGVDEGMAEDLKDVIEEPDKEENNEEKVKKEGSSSGSSSESESDDPDQEDNEFTKAFLMSGGKKERNRSPAPRSATPSEDKKRKLEDASSSPLQKKIKIEPPADVLDNRTPSLMSQSRPVTPPTNSRSGVTEDAVKRYLMRKPMSSKDLVKIFKSKKLGLSVDEMTLMIADILKRLKPKQTKINDILHFSYP